MKLAHKWMYFTGQKKARSPMDKDNPPHGKIEAAEEWEYEDSVASYLLSQRLPDSAVMRLSSCSTAQEQWEMVTKGVPGKECLCAGRPSPVVPGDALCQGGDIQKFLANLCYKREEVRRPQGCMSLKKSTRTHHPSRHPK